MFSLWLIGNASFNPAALAFDTFEHRYIGDEAFEKALSLVTPQDKNGSLPDVDTVKKHFGRKVEKRETVGQGDTTVKKFL